MKATPLYGAKVHIFVRFLW